MNKQNIFRDIYFNNGDKNKNNNIFFMNDAKLKNHISNFNLKYNTKYDFMQVKNQINYIKSYPGRLYLAEYTRPGEIEHLNNFCNVDNKYDYPKKQNTFRLITYNVHSFINSCANFKKNDLDMFEIINDTIDSRNDKNVIDLCKKLSPDILMFQEYSPLFLNNNEIDLYNFPHYYNHITDNKLDKNLIYNGRTDEILDIFIGNLIMTKFDVNDNYKFKYDVTQKINNKNVKLDPRPFIGMKINIPNNNNNLELLIFNIHPSPDYQSGNKESNNFKQIKSFIDSLVLKYPPHKYNIIIAGDFNNHHEYLLEYMNKKLFLSTHDFYGKNYNLFTGYHGVYLDYVFVSLHFLYDFSIVENKTIYVNYSDHYPVLFDFRVNNKKYINSQNETLNRYRYAIDNIFNAQSILDDKLKLTNEDLLNIFSSNIKELLNLDSIAKLLNCSIIKIPANTYLVHGTNVLVNDIPFELLEHKQDIINQVDVPKSFVFMYFSAESFMNWYGVNSELDMKRLIIYKTTKPINVLNLYKHHDNINSRNKYRLNMYLKLYNYY